VWVLQRDLLVWLSIGWRLPSFSRSNKVYRLAFEHTFYRLLTWQITSGIAADLAFNNMQYLLNANTYQRSVRSIAVAANSGMNLVQCLTEHGFVLTQQMKRVMQTSLHAGAWEQGVSHHLRLQSQQLDRKADDFFKWLPKFYYLLALLAVTQFMFV